jgi:membrane protein DedA with SNARE-associated domain
VLEKFPSTYSFGRTLLWGFLSALAWNALIFVAGVRVGMNFGDLSSPVSRYTTVVCILLAVVAVVLLVRWWVHRRKS